MSWDDALARTDEACARHFDTVACSAIAMCKPERAANAPEGPDPSRPGFGFSASIEFAPELNAMSGARSSGAADRNVRQVTRVCLTAVTTGWPWMLRQGDRVRTADALYQIAANPDQDGTARVALWLNRISG